jgi:phosphoglycolate phosphatase
MGFDQLLTALYTLPGFTFPTGSEGQPLVAPDIVRRDERGDYRAACDVVELPREYEKPDTRGLLAICKRFGVAPAETVVVGDSLRKDVGVAKAVGALDCWAEYGTYVSLEYRERLDIISANAITQRHAASVFESDGQKLEVSASRVLSNFAQLLTLV